MTTEERDQLKETLVEAARDVAQKLSALGPEWSTRRAALVENLREIARAYGEIQLGTDPETLEIVSAAGKIREIELDPETRPLDDTFQIGGHQIRIGHGPGWVVMNLFAPAGNPLAAWDGKPAEIRSLAQALLQRAELAETSGASFDLEELSGPRETGAESN